MAGDRIARILAAMAAGGDGGRSSVRLCEVTTDVTGVSGAGVMLMSGDVPQGSLCTINPVSALIEELQYTLGEGPCVDAYQKDLVVLEPDLFSVEQTPMDEDDVMIARAFADLATISVVQHRAATETQLVNEQLSEALTSRVLIEQAKGVIFERRASTWQRRSPGCGTTPTISCSPQSPKPRSTALLIRKHGRTLTFRSRPDNPGCTSPGPR